MTMELEGLARQLSGETGSVEGVHMRPEAAAVEIGLSAAIITVRDDRPEVLTVRGEHDPRRADDVRAPSPALPFGPFTPRDHRTLDIGLRDWVAEQTGLDLGYVEQLYTFADRGRHAGPDDTGPHVVSIGYLALLRPSEVDEDASLTRWRSWYDFFPWEDWRNGKPEVLADVIEPLLDQWSERDDVITSPSRPMQRKERLRIAFGMHGGTWDEEKVLERYELLYEAGLVDEA